MRSVLDFYRARPLVAVVVLTVGLAVAVATERLQKGDGVILPIAFVAAAGLVMGGIVAAAQRGRGDSQG